TPAVAATFVLAMGKSRCSVCSRIGAALHALAGRDNRKNASSPRGLECRFAENSSCSACRNRRGLCCCDNDNALLHSPHSCRIAVRLWPHALQKLRLHGCDELSAA